MYTCPRCWKGHRIGERCPHTGSWTLDAYRHSHSQLQDTVDAAESLALVRYHLTRPG
jgi:hypothetical protein